MIDDAGGAELVDNELSLISVIEATGRASVFWRRGEQSEYPPTI